MAKKKEMRKPVCGNCMEPINPGEVMQAVYAGYEYRHKCGRVIVKGTRGSGNAEVPTDVTYGPIPGYDNISTSEPTGDA